ncbi:hypothetical protein V1508DRAFT_61239 [Lipomyces doorenjongii]|uniref:uncharacterized protein n=1 Tax=Lipomyces doorenjongii TaxID=383834 RepID=UPI0034CF7095
MPRRFQKEMTQLYIEVIGTFSHVHVCLLVCASILQHIFGVPICTGLIIQIGVARNLLRNYTDTETRMV